MTNHLQSSSFNTPNGFGTPMASHQQNPNFNHSPIGSLNQVTEVLSNRIDQLFGMVTSSQQALARAYCKAGTGAQRSPTKVF